MLCSSRLIRKKFYRKRKWAIYYNTRSLLSWNKTTQSTRKQPKICLNYLACIGEPKVSMLVVKCSCVPLVPNFQDIRKVIGALSLRLVRTYHQDNIECANHMWLGRGSVGRAKSWWGPKASRWTGNRQRNVEPIPELAYKASTHHN
jgi:hypothetical protein